MRNKQIIMAFIVITAVQQSANAERCTCSNIPSGTTCHTDCIPDSASCQLYTCDGFTRCAPSYPCSDSGEDDVCYTVGESISSSIGTGCISYSNDGGKTNIALCDSCNSGGTLTTKTLCSGGTVTKYMCVLPFCAKGKYADMSGTCVACPEGGTTRARGDNVITDCYLPAGKAFTDDAGSGTYTENCYYTN